MVEKSIEQIKEEVAKESTYETWDSLKWHIGISDTMLDKVAKRYAAQFQSPTDLLTTEIMVLKERNQELEDSAKYLFKEL